MKKDPYTKQYPVRGIKAAIDEQVSRKFPERESLDGTKKFKAGHTGPRAAWLRALVSIGALDSERSIAAYELWQRALQIAAFRGDNWLRQYDEVKTKLYQEEDEFTSLHTADILVAANKIANLFYYTVQIFALDNDLHDFNARCEQYSALASIPQEVAFQIALSKFRERARREIKDVHAEQSAMQRVLANFQIALKTP
jgi:hypothetical protein